MGRFQVPWREIDIQKADQLGIQIVRRRSGGGTVYHDPGNWNFCFLRGERELHRKENLEYVQAVLADQGIPISINERFDLTYLTDNGVKKVSGSAFKQQKDRSYHHATLLVDAKIEDLKGVLGTSSSLQVSGKGIKSHPSPVTNLLNHHEMSYGQWCKQWMKVFEIDYELSEVSSENSSELLEEVEALKNWSWLWGETPENEISFNEQNYWIKNKNGLILETNSELNSLVGLELKNQNCEKVENLLPLWEGLGESQVRILTNLLKKPNS